MRSVSKSGAWPFSVIVPDSCDGCGNQIVTELRDDVCPHRATARFCGEMAVATPILAPMGSWGGGPPGEERRVARPPSTVVLLL